MKKLSTVTLLGIATLMNAQITPPTGEEVAREVNTQFSGWALVINSILGFLVFAGLIYVIAGIIGKREMAKGFIVSWILCILIWGIGYALFGSKF